MKSLNTYLTERLIINKNFKIVKANIEFYNKFCNFLSLESNIRWFEMYDIYDVISTSKLSIEDKTALNKIEEFFNIEDGVIYKRDIIPYFKKDCELYYDILKFIDDNKDAIEFFYMNEHTKSEDCLIYLFEAEKIKVAVWGHKKIVDKERATIAFQYIK